MAMTLVRIGTRGSALALAQAGWVRRALEERTPALRVELITIKTSGDRFLMSPIRAIGGKGIFVKEIEDALLRGEIDLAVHSMKDLPTEIPRGLCIAAVSRREDPRDALVSSGKRALRDLPAGSAVGTGSLRRQTQILHCRPDLSVVPIRGNVDTRLRKLDRGEVDALVMAAAGLKRLGREGRISEYLSPDICLSAVAQGALALETREGDALGGQIAFLHHAPTATEVLAERAFLGRLGGGCQIPVAARGWVERGEIRLMGAVGDPAGARLVRGEVTGPEAKAVELGLALAERLLAQGADRILAPARAPSGDSASRAETIHGGADRKPLVGRRIVITRPRSQSSSFIRGLEELGGEVVEFPTIEIRPPESYAPLDRAIERIATYDWIIFTSVNGVSRFVDRLRLLGKSVRDLDGCRIAAIGPETAGRLDSFNLRADLVPREYRAEAILRELGPEEVRGRTILLPRASIARDVLPRTLREWGARTDVVDAYRTARPRGDRDRLRAMLLGKKVDVVTFTSSSTVRNFARFFPGTEVKELLDRVVVACIGPITRGTAEEKGIRVDVVPSEYTVEGLTLAIAAYFKK